VSGHDCPLHSLVCGCVLLGCASATAYGVTRAGPRQWQVKELVGHAGALTLEEKGSVLCMGVVQGRQQRAAHTHLHGAVLDGCGHVLLPHCVLQCNTRTPMAGGVPLKHQHRLCTNAPPGFLGFNVTLRRSGALVVGVGVCMLCVVVVEVVGGSHIGPGALRGLPLSA
jgi:hypothetical protein